uniref:anthranilate synthase component II n=1 Tax=Ningiella ruwaisensis TaxID=2364274 RepID=UPI0010A04BC7|nr:aminodeoxychorismate/anthranilate synthase component II [Ningiella ruwaisensis]
MVVIIDNYDSFTYNLARYFEELEHQVTVVKNDAITIEQLQRIEFDHLVISPGPCTPDESGISMPAIKAFTKHLPILGVCLGHQAIAQCAGANIVRAEFIRHGKTSTIQCNSHSRLFSHCPERFEATRYHSLIIDEQSLPEQFSISAWCHDFGKAEIMAIENANDRLYGVQFHPESLLTEHGHQILRNFLTLG